MKIKPKIGIELDTEELAKVTSMEELFEFIVDLDEAVGSWDFTLDLCDHFDKMRDMHAKETHTHRFSEDDGYCACGDRIHIVS